MPKNSRSPSSVAKNLSFCLSLLLLVLFVTGCSTPGPSSSLAPFSSSTASLPPEEEPMVSVLTGLPLEEEALAQQRIAAVMINGLAAARPYRGISTAQMLVEAEVEGGITRLMAMFDDYKTMPELGPVRSGRAQFFELALPYQPLYLNNGNNVFLTQLLDITQYHTWNIGAGSQGVYFRDEERRQQGFATEHTSYTSGERLTAFLESSGIDTTRQRDSGSFAFVPNGQAPRSLSDGEAQRVEVVFSVRGSGANAPHHYATYFDYDPSTSSYFMSQNNAQNGTIDVAIDEANNQQLFFSNVIVIFATMQVRDPSSGSSGKQVYFGNGVGFYFHGGRYEKIRWQKGAPQDPLRLISNDGLETPITVNPGTNYVALVDIERAINFGFGTKDNVQTLGE